MIVALSIIKLSLNNKIKLAAIAVNIYKLS